MRAILIGFIVISLTSSCSRYIQISTVKSDILEEDSMLLRHSNDTFEIVYNLFSEEGLLAFNIYNKSDKPLYIDWKRSALIQGDSRKVYWENKSVLVAVTDGSAFEWFRNYSESRNYTYGVITKPEQISFIPPKTAVSMARFKVNTQIWNKDLQEKLVKVNDTFSTTLLTKEFENSSSPNVFRNFLTLSLDHKFSSEFYIDHSFWVSRVSHIKEKEFVIEHLNSYRPSGWVEYSYSYPFKKPNVYYNTYREEGLID